MLWDSLERQLETKSLEAVSVADITAEAGLNRATFYDHFPDKFALLNGLVASRFEELMTRRGIVFDGSCSGAIFNIILTTCDYLAALPGIDCPTRQEMTRHFESAMGSVVRGMILEGLRRHAAPGPASAEVTAATISGAIYGGAQEWVRTPERVPAQEAATAIFALVGPMLAVGEPADR